MSCWFQVELDTLYRFRAFYVRCHASMASEPGFYLEFSGFLQYFLAGFVQEPIPTEVNIERNRA